MNDLFAEYDSEMSHEEPFMLSNQKWVFCWAKYPNSRRDIGVYAFSGDVCYGYNAWREMNGIK
jgi:hypothetical protein